MRVKLWLQPEYLRELFQYNRQINCILRRLIHGNEKAVLDLTFFLKMVINPQQIGPVEYSPTIA
jgi:hypothetical protein